MPLLRRTFATFQPAERRQIGERARRGAGDPPSATAEGFAAERAALVLPVLRQIFAKEAQ